MEARKNKQVGVGGGDRRSAGRGSYSSIAQRVRAMRSQQAAAESTPSVATTDGGAAATVGTTDFEDAPFDEF